MTPLQEFEIRLRKIDPFFRNLYRKMFFTVDKEFKLFNKEIEYEQTTYQKNLAKIKTTRNYKKIALETMNIENMIIGYKDFDKNFDDNLKYELLKELNSDDNLAWLIKKEETLKKVNQLKNIADFY